MTERPISPEDIRVGDKVRLTHVGRGVTTEQTFVVDSVKILEGSRTGKRRVFGAKDSRAPWGYEAMPGLEWTLLDRPSENPLNAPLGSLWKHSNNDDTIWVRVSFSRVDKDVLFVAVAGGNGVDEVRDNDYDQWWMDGLVPYETKEN